MVKHIVLWNFNEETRAGDPEQVFASLKEQFEAMSGKVEGLERIEMGRGYKEGGRDLALYCEFTNREAEAAYQAHPLHQAAGCRLRQHTCDRTVIDYET